MRKNQEVAKPETTGRTRTDTPLVTVRARPMGPQCPFGNDSVVEFALHPGDCVLLSGHSGLGKTTLAMCIAGLLPQHVLHKLQIDVDCTWDPSLCERERCGVVFQQTALLDELTVAGNLCVALQQAKNTRTTTSTTSSTSTQKSKATTDATARIKQLLETVGLNYARDAGKRPSELSGGMGRRAALALQLAQNKHVIVLDEPFTGLDYEAAVSVAKELVHLRIQQQTALILISHEPHIAAVVMDETRTHGKNQTITLRPPKNPSSSRHPHGQHHPKNLFFGTQFRDRLCDKLVDYTLYSLPLILLAFSACGLALAMLSTDLLQRLDVTDRVLAIVDQEVRPMIKLLTGQEANALTMMGVKLKVRGMLNTTLPPAKATLFALGMAKLFVLEIGPLLTALLLAGRIGGSYAGIVATMQATAQTKLLRTIGVNPITWTFVPSFLAALVAGPILTSLGTFIALVWGDVVGPHYGLAQGDRSYRQHVYDTIFPEWRIRSRVPFRAVHATVWDAISTTVAWGDVRTTFSDSFLDVVIELATYPPIYHLLKAQVFMSIIMIVAEVCARVRPNLTPRGVPLVITSSVVLAGLLVILADWAFSQLWLLRK